MLSSRHLARCLIFAGAFVCALVAGCDSGPHCSVEGDVHFDGAKVEPGSIAFIPVDETDSRRATGQIHEGHYYLDSKQGPNPGKQRVEIYWRKKTGNKVPGEGGVPRDEVVAGVPPKYNSESQLTVEIVPGRNKRDFDLKK